MIANLAVTFKCNSRCTTCSIWQIKTPPTLSLEDIKQTFTQNRDFLRDVKSIQITGGEPTLHPDLPEIVGTIHSVLPRCTYWIPTNGLNPERIEDTANKILGKLDGRGLGVTVSIDGDRETHDRARGIPGSYSNAVATLQRLSQLREEYPLLCLSVGMTVAGENMNQLMSVYRLTREYDTDFSFRPVHSSEIYYRNRGTSAQVSEEFISDVNHIINEVRGRIGYLKAAPTVNYMQGAINYMETGRRKLKCTAGSRSIYIDAYGDVYPCLFIPQKMGNIRDNSLQQMYETPQTVELREKIGRLECPHCWVECETYRDINKVQAVLGSITSQQSS